MENTQYKVLVKIALGLTIAWIAWSLYDGAIKERSGGESHYHAANKYFEDGKYDDALSSYRKAIADNSQLIHANRGIARTLMLLEQYDEALSVFNKVIEQEPEFSASYANRGILHDRMQNYTAAISDYEKAIQLDPEIAEGPSWITRFLRNQAEKPPTILDRMKYLQVELSKPDDQRILQLPNKDEEQRPYKL
ncbi:MAG: tetratricopeptide repeat protein [Gammaproteobacteria bacterium]|nr:tetratricopeptide repeat protein [Gammaproteobacteria bacterium]